MSTVKVAAIQHPSAATAAITLDAAGGALIGGQAAYARNLLYNGAMQVSQRGTSTTGITTSSFNTADRWAVNLTTLGTWTQDIQADAPTGSGFRNSLRMLCTTADAAPAAGDVALVCQILEGQDCQRIAKGTSSARQLTLSFWVKSNVTGTYVAEVSDDDNTRAVSRSYTINASATWERKTITFPADTTGAIANDNTSGMRVNWWLGAGSTFTSGTLATTWASTTSANRAVGQTNLAAATNNYWQVTGVQLEVGPAATPFEFKSFGQELRECQRYYWRTSSQQLFSYHGIGSFVSTTIFNIYVNHPVIMRTRPSSAETSNVTVYNFSDTPFSITSISLVDTINSANASRLQAIVSGGTIGVGGFLFNNNNANGYVAFSAEL